VSHDTSTLSAGVILVESLISRGYTGFGVDLHMSRRSWRIGSRWNDIGYCTALKLGVEGASGSLDVHRDDEDDTDPEGVRECEDPVSSVPSSS